MCQEISGVITTGKRPRVLSHDPYSHSGAEEELGLKPGKYREWE